MSADWFKKLSVLAALLLAAVVALVWQAGLRVLDTSRWVAHTFEVMGELESVVSGLKDAESGARYYVITGRDDFLGRYEDAGSKADRSLKELSALVSDNPVQSRRLADLRKLSDGGVSLLDALVEARRREGFEAARRIALRRGLASTDDARSLVDDMQADEKRLLGVRLARERSSVRQAIFAVSLLCVLAVGLFVSSVFLLERELSRS